MDQERAEELLGLCVCQECGTTGKMMLHMGLLYGAAKKFITYYAEHAEQEWFQEHGLLPHYVEMRKLVDRMGEWEP